MAKRKKAGRPKGSRNKIISVLDVLNTEPKRRGRPAGKGKGRPAGIPAKKRGRPAGLKNKSLIAPGGHINGIHFIGKSLIVDTDQMSIDEVIFLGGKSPKVR